MGVEHEPAALFPTLVRDEIAALTRTGLGRDDTEDGLAGAGEGGSRFRGAAHVVAERHRAEHRLAPVAETITQRARSLFAPLPENYDRWSRVLSLGQDPRWRRFLVSRVGAGPGDSVLDVATGTGAVAIELAARTGCNVVGADQSPEMLAEARRRVAAGGLDDRIQLVEARAEQLPFPDRSFDAVTFTYLLRYVEDPAAALRELVRVVKPGGVIAMLEFGVPRGVWRGPWELYVRVGLPLAGRAISPGWHEVGSFLGGSIREFHRRHTDLGDLWYDAGLTDVRGRRLSLGGGLVVW